MVTDLVDEDMVLNHRKQAASALLFGMVALVTKPGQTFAPLLGTWLLCFYTGEGPGFGMGLSRLQGAQLTQCANWALGPGREREWQLADRLGHLGCQSFFVSPHGGRGAGSLDLLFFQSLLIHSFVHSICVEYLLCQALF